MDAANHEHAHLWPAIVGPHGLLFGSVSGADRTITRIEALSLTTGKRHVVQDEGRNPIYTASGHLLFFRNGTLLASPFDSNKLAFVRNVGVLTEGFLDASNRHEAMRQVEGRGLKPIRLAESARRGGGPRLNFAKLQVLAAGAWRS